LTRFVNIIWLIILAHLSVFAWGIDGGYSHLRGILPLGLGKGKLGLSLYQEYARDNFRPEYVGEYYMTTRGGLVYGFRNDLDIKLSFPYYVDVIDNFRYGSGDFSLGLKYIPPFLKFSSWANSFQVLATLPTGFKEDPLALSYPFIRPYSARKLAFWMGYQTAFQYNQVTFALNLAYYRLPLSDGFMHKDQTIFRIGEGYQGVTADYTQGTTCPQFPFVISMNYQLHPRIGIYLEYAGAMLRAEVAQVNDPVSLTPGLTFRLGKNLSLNMAVDFDLFETMPRTNLIMGVNFTKDLFAVPIEIKEYPITPENIVTIAFIDFLDQTKGGVGELISRRLREKIAYSGDFRLIDDEIVQRVIKEMAITPQTILLKSALERLGRTLNVDYIIAGQILDDRMNVERLNGVPFLVGKSGVVRRQEGMLRILIPESGELVYDNSISSRAAIDKGFFFMGIDRTSPGYFTDIKEKNNLLDKSTHNYADEVMRILYEKFYLMSGEKLIEHLELKNFR